MLSDLTRDQLFRFALAQFDQKLDQANAMHVASDQQKPLDELCCYELTHFVVKILDIRLCHMCGVLVVCHAQHLTSH